ncbi:MAG: FTR1 family protein [Chloroflexi bacterium]|nr:FTR1 family protein [Chloroflexota bacterium]MBU1750570.1 FTR1 family protein [Chloroflexota bacterium]
MIPSFLIGLREGLEAALIVGIVLSYLKKMGTRRSVTVVWWGVAAAVTVSLVAGIGLHTLGVAFEGAGEQIFEGAAMLLAAGVLTWMIFWMQRQGRNIRAELEADVRRAVVGGGRWALFALAFVVVVREGIETALFLTAAAFSASPAETLVGAGLGLAAAVALGYAIFAVGTRLDMRLFFRVTSVLLILFAAGLVAHGVHELQEAGIVPVLVEHLWDVNSILDENSTLGSILTSLFGYNGNPSLLEVVSYVGYYLVIGAALVLQRRAVGIVPAQPREAPQHLS